MTIFFNYTTKIKYDTFLVFLLVLGGGSLLKQSRVTALTLLFVTFIYIVYLLFKYKKPILRKYFYSSLTIFLLFVMLFLFQMLFIENNLFSNQYFTYSLQFTTIIIILYYIKVTLVDFPKLLYNVLTLIMYHALLSFFLWFIFKDILFTINIGELKADTLLYLFYYQNTINSASAEWKFANLFDTFTFLRNQGIFWESGVLQIFMNILLFLSLNYFHDKKITKLTILTILTTWSTTGLTILFIQLIVHIFKNIKNKKNFILMPIIIISMVGLGLLVKDNIIEKFTGDKKGSSIQRKLDTLSTLKIIESNPYVGIGLDSRNYFDLLSKSTVFLRGEHGSSKNTSGVSNSLLYLFLYFGIPLGILFIYALYNQSLINKNRIVFFIIIILSSSTEPVLLLTFFTLFIISGLEVIFKKRTKESYERNHIYHIS